MTQTRDPSTGQLFNDGVAYVLADAGTGFGFPQNRSDDGIIATRRKMTFPDGEGPTQINVKYYSGTSGQTLYFVVNALNDTHADAELTDPITQDSTTERFAVFDLAIQPQGLDIASITPIDRIDYLLSSADAGSVLFVNGA